MHETYLKIVFAARVKVLVATVLKPSETKLFRSHLPLQKEKDIRSAKNFFASLKPRQNIIQGKK
jgi:hypothetical protein